MVPVAGLEPAHLAATDFESVVSTNSTTLAQHLTLHGFASHFIHDALAISAHRYIDQSPYSRKVWAYYRQLSPYVNPYIFNDDKKINFAVQSPASLTAFL